MACMPISLLMEMKTWMERSLSNHGMWANLDADGSRKRGRSLFFHQCTSNETEVRDQ